MRHVRPAWLVVSALGVLVAYRAVVDSMPPCDCFEWRYLNAAGFRELALRFAVAAVFVVAGVAGFVGLLGTGPLQLVGAGLHRSAEVVSSVERRGLLWPIVTTAIGVPTALIMLSGRPNMLGLVPLGGVLVVWVGALVASSKLVAVGALIGLGSGVLILGWLLTLLILLSGMRI